jgi:hypothetical protein
VSDARGHADRRPETRFRSAEVHHQRAVEVFSSRVNESFDREDLETAGMFGAMCTIRRVPCMHDKFARALTDLEDD